MKLFVAMPYGPVTGRLDQDDLQTQMEIEFDEVWEGVIKPAIPPGWEAKRADELHEPGIIDKLYAEWLLEADVVLADLTFSNPNVFYELGIRQALSQKSTVLIAQKRSTLPFDVRNQSVVYYDYFHAPSASSFRDHLTATLMAAAAKPAGSRSTTTFPACSSSAARKSARASATRPIENRNCAKLRCAIVSWERLRAAWIARR